jgi:hypothetical protein
VHGERLNRIFYENYIRSTIDQYVATLMRREPAVIVEGAAPGVQSFYTLFSEDCDLLGMPFYDSYTQSVFQAAHG